MKIFTPDEARPSELTLNIIRQILSGDERRRTKRSVYDKLISKTIL